MGKGKSQTIGFHYLFSILFGIGRGPINELRAIKVGDKMAWEGHNCDGPGAINKANLFGGEKKEGGIQGPFHLNQGAADQVLPGPLTIDVNSINSGSFMGAVVSMLLRGPWGGKKTLPAVKTTIAAESGDALISDMRGVTTFWFDGLISSMNPYPKEWKFRVRRYSAGWHNDEPWYPAKSVIFLEDGKIYAMNPAHIIYQCLTDPSWGRGLAASRINENSFIYAANTFCTEGFGLCLKWMQKEDIDQFIKIVLDHVGGVLYQDPETGEETLKLLRDDYVWADLPVFAPGSGLVEINEDDSASSDTAFNEVIGTGHDPVTDEDFQMRVHNLAARYSNGAPNPEDKGYPGVPTRGLLARVLQRDLKQHASGLKKFVVTLDRAGFKIRPGGVFRIQDTRRGIVDITLRAGEIEDISFKSGRITIKAIQDVFSLPSTAFATVPVSTWTPPPTEAEAPLAARLVELSYRDILRAASTVGTDQISDTDAYVGELAVAPNATSLEYEFLTRAVGDTGFTSNGRGPFTGTALLGEAVTPLQESFLVTDPVDFSEDNIGQALLLGDEIIELVDYDPVAGTLSVLRGCADTIPAAHALGARLWTIDDDLVPDTRTYQDGETVEALALTATSSDLLTPEEGMVQTITVAGRAARPYPPGNVTLGGVTIYSAAAVSHAEPLIAWAHRDRIQQEDVLVSHGEPSTGPEAGVTYTVRLFDPADLVTPLREEAGIAGDSWTYDAAMQAADTPPTHLIAELESERDGLPSWKAYRFDVYLNAGYGLGYGLDYGGTA